MQRAAWDAGMSSGAPALGEGRASTLIASPHEFLVQSHPAAAQRAFVRRVGREVSTHEAEDRLSIELDRGSPPETPDAHDLRPDLLHEVDQQLERGARAHEVLDEQHLRALADETLELDRQRHPALATAHTLHPVHD